MRTASATTSSAKRAPRRVLLRSWVKVVRHELHQKRWSGWRGRPRAIGAAAALPLRLVSRLEHLGQRTRRFPHAHPPYPGVYRISSRITGSDLGFCPLSATLNLTLSIKAP